MDFILPHLSSAEDRIMLTAKAEEPATIQVPETILQVNVEFTSRSIQLFQTRSTPALSIPRGKIKFEVAIDYLRKFVNNSCPYVTNNIHLRTAPKELQDLTKVRIFSMSDCDWLCARLVLPTETSSFSSEMFYRHYPNSGQHFGIESMIIQQQTFWFGDQHQETARATYVRKLTELNDSGGYESRYRAPRLERKFESELGTENSQIYTYVHHSTGTAFEQKADVIIKRYASERNTNVCPGTNQIPPPYNGTGSPAQVLPFLNLDHRPTMANRPVARSERQGNPTT